MIYTNQQWAIRDDILKFTKTADIDVKTGLDNLDLREGSDLLHCQ
jgi:hypothetical protein